MANTNAQQIAKEFLTAYNIMSKANRTRTLFAAVRDTLKLEWFSERGIREKFKGMTSDKFIINEFATADNVNSMFAFSNEFKINKLMGILNLESRKVVNEAQHTAPTVEYNDTILVNENEPLVEQPYMYAPPLDEPLVDSFIEAQIDAAKGIVKPDTAMETQQQILKAEKIQTTTAPTKTSAAFSLNIPLSDIIREAVDETIAEMDVVKKALQLIKEEAHKLQPHVIKIGERPEVTISGTLHYKFERALQLSVRESQVFFSGPAGTGKTKLASDIAKAMGLRFAHISCTAGMSEAHLLGRMVYNGDYVVSEFVECYENGGLFLFDEVDAADANTMLAINSALANGILSIPNRQGKNSARRHPDFICICAANTWGFGSNEYAGRNMLDQAFLDRFPGSKLEVDYDETLERKLAHGFEHVAKAIWKIRKNVVANKLRRVVSTRAIVSGVRAAQDNEGLASYLDLFMTGWTSEEKQKALAGVDVYAG